MIPVTLGELVFLCLGALLAGIFGAWIISESRRRRRESLAFRGVLRCTMCGCEFEDPAGAELARCPRCGTMNERLRLNPL